MYRGWWRRELENHGSEMEVDEARCRGLYWLQGITRCPIRVRDARMGVIPKSGTVRRRHRFVDVKK